MQTAQQDQQTRVYQDSLQGPDIDTQDIMTLLEQNQEYKEQNIDEVFDELEQHTWEQLGTDVIGDVVNDVVFTGLMFGTGALVAKAERHRIIEPVKQYKYNHKLSAEENIQKLQETMQKQTKYIQNQADKITYKGFSNSVNTAPENAFTKYDPAQLKHISEKEYMDRLQNISMQQDIMNKQQQEFKEILGKQLEERLKRNYEGTNTKIRQYNEQLKELDTKILNLDREYNKINADLNDKLLLKDKALKTRESLQNNIEHSQIQIDKVKNQIEQLPKDQQKELKQINKDITKQDEEIKHAQEEIDKDTQNKKQTKPQKKSSQIQSSLNELDNLIQSLEEAQTFKTIKQQELKEIEYKYQQKLKDLETELKEQQAKLETHNKDYASLEKEIDKLSAEEQRLRNELELKKQQKETIEESKAAINNTNVLNDFKKLADDYTNFGNNAKEFTQDDSFIFTFDDTTLLNDEPRVVRQEPQGQRAEGQRAEGQRAEGQRAEGQNIITIDQLIDKGLPELKNQLSRKKGYAEGEGFVAKQDQTYKEVQEMLHKNQYVHRDQQMSNIVERINQFEKETNEMLQKFKDMQEPLNKLDAYNISPELPYIDDYINKSSKQKKPKQKNLSQKDIQMYIKDADKYLQELKTKSYTANVSDQTRKNIQNLQNSFKQTNKVDALDINQLWPENNGALKAPSLNEPKSIITQYQDLLKEQANLEKEIKQYNKQLNKIKQGDTQKYVETNNFKQLKEQALNDNMNKQQTFLKNIQTIRDKLNKINFEK